MTQKENKYVSAFLRGLFKEKRTSHNDNFIASAISKSLNNSSNTKFTNNGFITNVGNSFTTPKGTYHLVGKTLKGPDGKTWNGVDSTDEAMGIIRGNQK